MHVSCVLGMRVHIHMYIFVERSVPSVLCTGVSESAVSKPKASSGYVGGNKPPRSGPAKGYGGSNQRRRSDSDFYSSLAVQGSEDDSDGEAVRDCIIMCRVWVGGTWHHRQFP